LTEPYRFRTVPDVNEEARQPARKLLWPDARRGPWLLEGTWGLVAGRWECVGLTARSVRRDEEIWAKHLPLATSTSEGVPMTAELWRSVPVGKVVAEMRRRQVAENAAGVRAAKSRTDVPAWALDDLQSALDMWSSPVIREGTAPERTASVYLAAWRQGRNPTQAVAEHFTISNSAAAKRVARARAAGLLPRTQPGKAAGHVPTPEKDKP
jgi:hypothetical protein